ncbi:hypothetical protein MAPG_11564 [Magnaporthiopsis poae ATCC 64411]|uniref:Secreted protein n=1 Tax=Magnaporthiopsis poae (strain ATCC 64411 / 73-15) TaxID=644358 RepID=A0A0C4EFL3_MAGP6|nr:hypothetical protein MAPG_11564 [Magnaporthiopsis poae ATCC 64411]
MRPITIIISILLPALTAAAPTTSLEPRQSLPPNERIRITSVTGAGTGCPSGTWSSQISQDGTSVTLGFDQFEAFLNPASDRDLSCTLILAASYPTGCVASTVVATSHGFAEFPGGNTGTVEASYGTSPGRLTTGGGLTRAVLSGGVWAGGQPWLRTDNVGSAVNAGSGGRTVLFFVNTRAYFAAPAGSSVFGSLRMDDLSVSFTNQRRVTGQC